MFHDSKDDLALHSLKRQSAYMHGCRTKEKKIIIFIFVHNEQRVKFLLPCRDLNLEFHILVAP